MNCRESLAKLRDESYAECRSQTNVRAAAMMVSNGCSIMV
jgi:hypothetical protein